MNKLTLAALAVVTLSPLAANAAGQFCDAPLTPAAEMNVKSTPHYQAYPEEVSKAVVDFCWLGMEAARQRQSADQVAARAGIESQRWVTSHYGNDGMQDSERWALEGGLLNAMIAGYSLTPQPAPLPGKKTGDKKAAVSGVDDLLGNLSAGKNTGPIPQTPQPRRPMEGASQYATDIRNAIKTRLKIDPAFNGKACALHIDIARDGKATVKGATGDLKLCGEAIKAARAATIPAAPNDELYQAFKSPVLDIRP